MPSLSGPSGVGKGRLVKSLLYDYSRYFHKVVTHTTRQPRPSEINGTSYHFTSRENFHQLVASGNFFAEHAKVHNNYYGVSFAAWEKARLDQKIPILEIDIEGAKTILAKEKELNIAPRYLFIAPPSIEMLAARLTRRGTESSEDIELRLRNAQIEIDEATKSSFFDFILVNNEYQLSVNQFFRLVRDWSDFPFPRLHFSSYC